MAETMSDSRRKLVKTSTLSAGIVLSAALLALVNYFGWKYHKRFDWTESQLYALSEKTLNVVGSLEEDVDVVVFSSPAAPLAEPVKEILARYQATSPHLKVRFVDPAKNLLEARRLLEQYETRYVEGTVKVVFNRGSQRRIFEESDLAEYDYSALQLGGEPTVESFKGEEVFTSALVGLSAGELPRILFTTGHGELKLDDVSGAGLRSVRELLGRDNVEVEEWPSLGKASVPEGTDLVVVAGPTTSFVPPELAVLADYLAGGGRMLWLLDPTLTADNELVDLGLKDWLAGYGVRLGDELVFDLDRAVPFFGAETFFVETYADHPVTRALRQADVRVIFALTRAVGAGEAVDGYQVTELLKTGAAGWGERDLAALPNVEAGDDDLAGPVSVGVAVEAGGEDDVVEAADGGEGGTEAGEEPPGDGMRMVILGDADFASDGLIASAGNPTLVDNAFNWLLEREAFLGIPPKKPEQVRLNLNGEQLWTAVLFVFALPLAALAAGVVVYFKRRR